jgi:hypothetical protein
MVGALEVPGIIVGPKTLARGFARFATFRLAAIGLGPGVAIVREEELFATPAQPFSDALHDPVPPGQKCNIRNRKGSRGLNAGRRQKNDGIVSDYEEKDRPGRRPCSRRRRRYNFRLSVTIDDDCVVSGAVDAIHTLPELLLPGVLRRGATSFKICVEQGRLPFSSGALVDELINATEHVANEVLRALNCEDLRTLDGEVTLLGTLFGMAVVGRQTFCTSDLRNAGLPELPIAELCKLKWIYSENNHLVLTDMGCRILRRQLNWFLNNRIPLVDSFDTITYALEKFVKEIANRTSEEGFDSFAQALEDGIVWLRICGFAGSKIESVLLQVYLPYKIDDVFFPILPKEVITVQQELRSIACPGELGPAVADFVLAVRSNVDSSIFLKEFGKAVDCACKTLTLSTVHLRALDFGAHLAERHYHVKREILEIRNSLLDRLLFLNKTEEANVGVLLWAASWILNSARLKLNVDGTKDIKDIAEIVVFACSRLQEPKTKGGLSSWLLIQYRLSQFESRLPVSPSERTSKLHDTLELAFNGLRNAPDDPRWVHYLAISAHYLAEELPTDEGRNQLVAEVLKRLSDIIGDPITWPLVVREQTAIFARKVAALNADIDHRLQQVLCSIQLLAPTASQAISLAALGDGNLLLLHARSYAFAAVCYDDLQNTFAVSSNRQKAVNLTLKALQVAPSAPGWKLYLSLLEQQEDPNEKLQRLDDLSGRSSPRKCKQLEDNLKLAREWLKKAPSWNEEEGQLALWCCHHDWQSQGSLETLALTNQKMCDGIRQPEKRAILKQYHRKRHAELAAIERRSGPFIDLYVAYIRNEMQLQRLLAIYGNHIVDSTTTLQYFAASSKLWPDNYTLISEKGRFHRYVWDHFEAILAFRHVLSVARGGHARREAAVELAEALLTASEHCDEVNFSDGKKALRSELIDEVQKLISELPGFRGTSKEYALLFETAKLEAGLNVDWDEIDESFCSVIGGVDAYATTIATNIERLQGCQTDASAHLADLVKSECTDPDVLRRLGSLYLVSVRKRNVPVLFKNIAKSASVFVSPVV